MSAVSHDLTTTTLQCAYCGKRSPAYLRDCPNCHETLLQLPKVRREQRATTGNELRRGLLYLLLAGVVHYFAGGYSQMALPVEVSPVVPLYLTPALAVAGMGLFVFGFISRFSK